MGVLWLLAMGSLIGVHLGIRKKPSPKRAPSKIVTFIKTLDQDLRIQLSHYEDAAILMENGEINLIGRDFKQVTRSLADANIIHIKKVDVQIGDRLALERSMLAGEVFKKLNNAEKVCLADGHAAILFQDGDYRFIVVRAIYEKYIEKYGTACTACEDSR